MLRNVSLLFILLIIHDLGEFRKPNWRQPYSVIQGCLQSYIEERGRDASKNGIETITCYD